MLGGRSTSLVVRSVFEPEHYVALGRMVTRYPAFPRVAKRYFVGGGAYPWPCRVRTPTGVIAPLTYTHHDIFTVHEIFCREDYFAGEDLGVAVDIGSNIGISALYFLSRNNSARVHLFEPVPRNLERLAANLAGLDDRYELQPVAVGPTAGEVDFTVEPTGRYGGIGVPGAERIAVQCRAIGDVLEEVLEQEGRIDVLKIDTEGAEVPTVMAIPEHQLRQIRTIVFETRTPVNPSEGLFEMSFATDTCRLARR